MPIAALTAKDTVMAKKGGKKPSNNDKFVPFGPKTKGGKKKGC